MELYQNPEQFFSVIPHGIPFPHSNTLQYYVKREKCKVIDVIFPSGCEARAINLDNKNVKIDIFTGGSSLRSKIIFTAISQHPTRKHEINDNIKVVQITKSVFDRIEGRGENASLMHFLLFPTCFQNHITDFKTYDCVVKD